MSICLLPLHTLFPWEAMRVTLAGQALILTLGNGLTRGLGFLLRLLLARWMGAEALGMMEMANSVGMLALTPVTAGIPSAMSRLTAKRSDSQQPAVLQAGLGLILRMVRWLMPAFLLLSPLLAWLLNDLRTLPAILLNLPDILLLGLCSAYGGYCYGQENSLLPAVAECAEQAVRFVLSLGLILLFRRSSIGMMAALPGAAEAVAALAAVMIFRHTLPVSRGDSQPLLQKELFRLSVPTTLSRLCLTGMRALEAVVLPVCLRLSGLSAGAATAQFGLLTGMAMPSMMLPGIVTSALCMVTTPAISRSEENPRALCCTARRLIFPALGVGIACMLVLNLGAELISTHLYHTPELIPLLRLMSPAAVLFALHQVQAGMIAGLGLQRKSLTGTILSSCISLVLMAWLARLPQLRLFGAALATMAGQLVTVGWDGAILWRRCHRY